MNDKTVKLCNLVRCTVKTVSILDLDMSMTRKIPFDDKDLL